MELIPTTSTWAAAFGIYAPLLENTYDKESLISLTGSHSQCHFMNVVFCEKKHIRQMLLR
jgi:hypothetical protein